MLSAQTKPPPARRPLTVCGETARPTSRPTKIATSHQYSSRIEATSGPVGHDRHDVLLRLDRIRRRGRRGRRCLVARASGQGEQLVAQRLDLVLGNVGEPRGPAARARHPQPQLGDAKQPREPGPDDVDRLHLREREPQRLPPEQPGLDPQVVVLDPPPRHEPGDETGQDDEGDDRRAGESRGPTSRRPKRDQDQEDEDRRSSRGLPARAGESGCNRCQLSGGVVLTGRPPAPRRARPGCRAGERPPRAPARGCARPWTRPPYAGARSPGRRARSSGPAVTSMNCIRPYGTTDRRANITPRRTSRSSSRSA